MSFSDKIFGKGGKLYEVLLAAKTWWLLLIALSFLSSGIIMAVGLSTQQLIRETGTVFFILLHPIVLLLVGLILSNAQFGILLYIAYLSGKKIADKPSSIFSATLAYLLLTWTYFGSLLILAYLTGTFGNDVNWLFSIFVFTIVSTPISTAIFWTLYYLGKREMTKAKPAVEKKPAGNAAGFWRRALAKLVDSFIAVAFFTIIWVLFFYEFFITLEEQLKIEDFGIIAGLASSLLFLDLYFMIFHWRFGTTIGKKWFDMKVVKINGEKLSFVDSFMRTMGEYITRMLLFSYYLIAFDKQKQARHDKLAETYVVSTSSKEAKT